jgi:lipoprotein-anchoring transpeptidase ErfK/SrfK
VQGPFRAELSFSDREITLFIGQYYAGRFNCAIGRDLPAQIRSLDVVRIEGAKPYVDFRTGEQIPANDPKNPYGDRWIELSANSLPGTAGLGIHSYGSAVDASDTRGCISVSPEEANDLALILSPGSRITILP